MCELGMNDAPCGVPFGCDASKLSRAGIPSIVFGPGSIDQAHSAEEFVELEQVERALEFYRRLMLQFGSTRSA
jgi:acetylornithine deacetylase